MYLYSRVINSIKLRKDDNNMENIFTIVDLNISQIPDIVQICNDELGTDYHTINDFHSCLENKDYICKVVVNEQESVIGFFMTFVMNPEAAGKYLNLPDSEAKEKLLSVEKIGIMDSAAIESSYKKKGLGRVLIKAGYEQLLEINPDVVCGMAWKKADGLINVQKLLLELGLESSLEIKRYWNLVTNKPNGHECPVCITPPCNCYGVLYTKYI